MPILQSGIVIEVCSNFASTLLLQLGDEFEPHLLGEHVAYRIEVARVEALDVSGEKRALGFRQNGAGKFVGLLCQLAKTRTAAIERGLDGGNAAVCDDTDLLKRVAEHVHQDHAAALRHRKAHEGP